MDGSDLLITDPASIPVRRRKNHISAPLIDSVSYISFLVVIWDCPFASGGAETVYFGRQ
jgi:hypothetical protein